jgi:hypothetical protein
MAGRRFRPTPPPERVCRGGCGRKRRTWSSSWLCRFCLLEDQASLERESFRATRRRLAGRCTVCGGPYPDGSGCEFCPVVEPAELELERGELAPGVVEQVRSEGYGHAAAIAARLTVLDGGRPDSCCCLYYGRGLNETRVLVSSCPVHRVAG